MNRPKTRDELLLEEQSSISAPVESGFNFRFREIDDPPRIELSIIGKTSSDGMIIWFEQDQFAMLLATGLQMLPLSESMAIFQHLFGSDRNDLATE
jgi:hypothetical protein